MVGPLHSNMECDLIVKDEFMLGPEHVEEASCSSHMDEATMLPNLYKAHIVKDEVEMGPECEEAPRDSLNGGSETAILSSYAVKDEIVPQPECVETLCDSLNVSETARLFGLYTDLRDHTVKTELVLGPGCVETPGGSETGILPSLVANTVKEELESKRVEASCVNLNGVNERAILTGLYMDHIIKEELVLGPTRVQARDVVYAFKAGTVKQERQVLRECSVVLERIHGNSLVHVALTTADHQHILSTRVREERDFDTEIFSDEKSKLSLRDSRVRLERLPCDESTSEQETTTTTPWRPSTYRRDKLLRMPQLRSNVSAKTVPY